MRVFKTTRLLTAILAFGMLLFNLQTTHAQASANHKANIIADEFTAKGGSDGWGIGQKVPNLYFNDIFTKKFHLHDKLTKPVIIELYNPDDNASKKNKTYLKSFYKQYDVNIISIATTDYPNRIRQEVKNAGVNWPHIQDDSKKFTGKTFAQEQSLDGVSFILISGNKQVKTIVKKGEPIGKLGAALQKEFANY